MYVQPFATSKQTFYSTIFFVISKSHTCLSYFTGIKFIHCFDINLNRKIFKGKMIFFLLFGSDIEKKKLEYFVAPIIFPINPAKT